MAIINLENTNPDDDADFHVAKEQKDPAETMRRMFGPGHVDQSVRQAIQACWMALPKERRTVDEVEKEMRRLLDRAIANLREDAGSFGLPTNI